jgi:hypothetical protein
LPPAAGTRNKPARGGFSVAKNMDHSTLLGGFQSGRHLLGDL